jgi:magnesium chelatase family protein
VEGPERAWLPWNESVDPTLAEVETDLVQGLPQFLISGLPDVACKQSPDRIKAAAANSGVPVPNRRWTVNLSPASMPKGGSGFDLSNVGLRHA